MCYYNGPLDLFRRSRLRNGHHYGSDKTSGCSLPTRGSTRPSIERVTRGQKRRHKPLLPPGFPAQDRIVTKHLTMSCLLVLACGDKHRHQDNPEASIKCDYLGPHVYVFPHLHHHAATFTSRLEHDVCEGLVKRGPVLLRDHTASHNVLYESDVAKGPQKRLKAWGAYLPQMYSGMTW